MDCIYLDNNATTPLLPAVWEAMRPFQTDVYGNPASAHQAGRHARRALEDAREGVAACLGASPDEVIFTSGATEANNLALFGLVGDPPGQVIVSAVEHPSVAEPVAQLAAAGFSLDLLPVDPTGVVHPEQLAALLTPQTVLVSIMLANNETGAVQPVRELAARVAAATAGRDISVAFHWDAAQAVGKLPLRFQDLGVTALTLSGHKFHGPKGIGALVLRRSVKLRPRLWGGHQQRGRRPGTEPVALAVGLAKALQLWHEEAQSRLARVHDLRLRFLQQLRQNADPIVLNGPETGGLPHTVNVSFPGCRAESLLMNLDLAGVACSTGSACSSGSLLPSPVLQAMGLPPERLHSAMRFSFSALLTEAEMDEAVRRIAMVVERLRRAREH